MQALRNIANFVISISIFVFLFLASPVMAQTGSLTLAWNANPETDIIGYHLYYKSGGSGAPYDGTGAYVGDSLRDSPIVVSPSPSPTITLNGLDPNLDYEFAVTALNSAGESGYSAPVRIFSISSQADANGSVDPSGPVWVIANGSKTVTITPNEGCVIADVRIDGTSVGAVDTYTFTDVTANKSLSAIFAADSDYDGLSDADETDIYGTDPYWADSDNDGIDDGIELDYWGSDWDLDIDGDGIANNLLDADADGDDWLDGQEDENGNGILDPDESDPSDGNDIPVQRSTIKIIDMGNGLFIPIKVKS